MNLVQWLLLPAFAHVVLVLTVGMMMGRARVKAVRGGVRIKDIATDNSRWPDDVRKIANNYTNQFEVPVLFYAALALIVATGKADAIAVVLAWLFVASRIAHTLIHTGANKVLLRFRAFLFGFACVAVLWVWFAIRLYVIG